MSFLGGLGAAIGGLLGFAGQESANDAQMEMLERQIELQKEVLQNKVQWNVDDMRSAGLNPVLSVMGSGGASGSAPSASAPQVGNSGAAAMNSALQFAGIMNSFNEQMNRTIATKSSADAKDAEAVERMMSAWEVQNRVLSGYWPAQSKNYLASAKAHNAEVARVGIYERQVSQWVQESISRQHQISAEIEKIGVSMSLMRQQSQTEESRRAMMSLEGQLRAKQSELVSAQKETEYYRRLEIMARGDLLELQAPKAIFEAEYYSDDVNKHLEKGRKWKNALNPFNHGGS